VEVQVEATGDWLWAEYDSMIVQSESDNYRLQVSGYQGNAGDAFNNDRHVPFQANGMQFSTPDADNDESWVNCAANFKCGWWFQHCSSSSLNGITSHRFWSSSTTPTTRRVSASRMMLRCGSGY